MSVGVLTGRPAEEMPGSTGDLLLELLQLHEHVRQAMSGVVQALWPSVSLPEGLGGLDEKLQGVRRRLRLWKISACRQGPTGPTSAMCFGSDFVYRVFTMAQASLAP